MDPLALFHAIGVRGQKNGLATTVMLVEHGADVNHVAENWGTPLAYAVHRNAKEKLLFLLKHGADPTIPSRRNRITAIGSAASSGRLELYQILKAAVDGQI
jgi:ankyrin repeat protein